MTWHDDGHEPDLNGCFGFILALVIMTVVFLLIVLTKAAFTSN